MGNVPRVLRLCRRPRHDDDLEWSVHVCTLVNLQRDLHYQRRTLVYQTNIDPPPGKSGLTLITRHRGAVIQRSGS
jgi:hypothetical protein